MGAYMASDSPTLWEDRILRSGLIHKHRHFEAICWFSILCYQVLSTKINSNQLISIIIDFHRKTW
jgi:hypothetical protein